MHVTASTSLAHAWGTLTGPRVEDFWIEVLEASPAVERGTDLLVTDFESGTADGWGQAWFGTPAAVTNVNTDARANTGSRSMRIDFPTAAAGCGAQRTVSGLAIGQTYTASISVWVPAGTPDIRFGDPFGYTQVIRSDEKDRWQRLELSWVATLATVYFTVRSSQATTSGMSVWIDDFRVHEGQPARYASERVLGPLDGVTSCRVEHNVNATVRGGMSLSMRGLGESLNWSRVRFRPWVRVNNLTWPLGVYLPASPSESHDEFGLSWDVPCLDKTSLLDGDLLTATYSTPPGEVVTDIVADLIASVGETSAVTPSDLTTRSPMTWEPGTPKRRVINDLLDSINYFALWADRRGQLRAEPYRRPQDRPLAASFADGEAAIHSPRWTREQDIAGVPNRVVLTVDGDDENPGMVATADNVDPASPYSIPSRGRVVARPYPNVEAASQSVLDALAARYLSDASTPSATLSVSHASVPLDGNDVVRFSSAGADLLAVVEGWQVDLTPGALMTGTWRELS